MAVNPDLKVEIAFASEPLDTTPTWTDVSAYVLQSRDWPGVSIRRGRQSSLSYFEAGSCQLTLSNRDRRFDPSYAAGPYYGQLLPRKLLRVTATWATVDYVMFTGFVTGWPQAFAKGGVDAAVTIEAIDAMAWLAENRVPNDLVYDYANTTIGSLALFLRAATAAAWSDAANVSGTYQARVAAGTGQTASNPMDGSTSAAIGFDGSTRWEMAGGYQAATSAAWSLAFVFYPTAYGVSGTTEVLGGGTGSGSGFPGTYLYWTSNGQLSLNVKGTGVDGSVNTAAGQFTPHNAYHVVYTYDGSTTAKVYVNGVDSTSTSTVSGACELALDTFGDSKKGGIATTLFQGQLADIAVFSKQLSAAEVLAFYDYSRGYVEETSTARATRILDDVGWPSAWRDIAVDTSTTLGHTRATCGELVYNATDANTLLQEVQDTEQGMVFVAKNGYVTFRGRYYRQEVTEGATVQQVFSDDGDAAALSYSTFGFAYNDIDIVNDATVTTPTTWAKASDATSKAAHGLQSDKVDTLLTTWTDADSMARGLVAQGKDPTWRVPPILVYPANNTARWDEVLGLELGHRVSLEQTPMAVGTQNAQDVTIEQIEWLIEAGLWSFIVGGSPCKDVWFIWGSSLVDGPDVIGY